MPRVFIIVTLLAAASCTTTVDTNPSRSATEELLISTASDRAAEQLAVQIPKNSKVFVDSGNFAGTDAKDMDSKYAVAAIHASLLKRGAHLVGDKKGAQTIIEVRSGALSTDQKSFLIGVPQFNIPIPFSATPLAFPEIALYKDADQKGVAKFGIVSYDAKTGTLIAEQEPQYGFAHNVTKTLLIFFSWRDNDVYPDDVEKRDKKKIGFFSMDKSDLPEDTTEQSAAPKTAPAP
jgi:hypothetical protein